MPAAPHLDQYRIRRDDALIGADQVFAQVPSVPRLDGCTFCYTDEELIRLGGDQTALSDDLVRRFAVEGIDHWNEDQYQLAWRRLAARILRLIDAEELANDVGQLLRGLGYECNRIDTWPVSEREAILDVLYATLDLWLVDGRAADDVIELLGALAHVYDDITPWFAYIDASSASPIEAGLVRLAVAWSVELLWGEEPSWWWYPPDPIGVARDWLCSPAVQSRLASFADRNPRCKNASDALITTQSLAGDGHGLWLYPQLRPKSWVLPMLS